jgi:hypothetical protein
LSEDEVLEILVSAKEVQVLEFPVSAKEVLALEQHSWSFPASNETSMIPLQL